MSRDIRDVERWIHAHPTATWFVTIGLAVLILEFSILIRYLLNLLDTIK